MSAGGVHVEQVQHWLATLPPILVYLVVGGVVGTESLGVPVPGEIALVAASLLAATGHTNVWWVALGASAGAIVGDSIGYALGRRGGRAMLERFGRRFPKHFGPAHLAKAEKMFGRWGLGRAADRWLSDFSWVALVVAVVAGGITTLVIRHRTHKALHAEYEKESVEAGSGN